MLLPRKLEDCAENLRFFGFVYFFSVGIPILKIVLSHALKCGDF